MRKLLMVTFVSAALSAAGASLKIVTVNPTDFYCRFNPDCAVETNEWDGPLSLPNGSGEALLRTRTFAGEPGSIAELLYAYVYQIDLRGVAAIGQSSNQCVTSFQIELGSPATFDFDGDGSDDDVFVYSSSRFPTEPVLVAAERIGNRVTFTFQTNRLCESQASALFGIVSPFPPREVAALIRFGQGNTSAPVAVAARAPALPPALVRVIPTNGVSGQSLSVTGHVASGSVGIRLLWSDGFTTHGLTEGAVDGNGNFALPAVQLPQNAVPGQIYFGAIASDSLGNDVAWTPFTVLPPQPATISGRVLASNGQTPTAGAPVMLLNTAGLSVGSATTDANGNFTFPNLPPGDFTVVINGGIYIPQNASVGSGGSMNLNFQESSGQPNVNLAPVVVTTMGAIVLPGGSFNSASPAHIGEPENVPFARLVSLRGKGLQPLNVRFWAAVQKMTLPPSAPLVVAFAIMDGNTVIASRVSSNTQLVWSAPPHNVPAYVGDFNAFELPPGNLKLRITIFSTGFATVYTQEVPLHIAPLGDRWYSGYVKDPVLSVTKTDFYGMKYNFSGLLPNNAVAFDEPIDLGIMTVNNRMSLAAPIAEEYRNNGAWGGQASVDTEVTFLDHTFIDQMLYYNGPAGSTLPPSTYSLPTVHVDLGDKICVPIPGFNYGTKKCVKLCLIGCKKCVGLHVGASFCISGAVDFDSAVKKNLALTARVTPHVQVSLPIEIYVDVVVCGGSATVEPYADAALPIYYDPDRNPVTGFDEPCLTIGASLDYKFKCFGITFFKGTKDLGSHTFGCSGGLKNLKSRAKGGSEPPSPPHHSIAVNNLGGAITVWVAEDDELEMLQAGKAHFSVYDGGQWSDPAPIYAGNELAEDPKVAFIDDTHALAVWVRPKTLPNEEELSEVNETAFFGGFELYYAIWDGVAWTAPSPITNDDVMDARPVLASNPATGRALLAWLRSESTGGEDGQLALYVSFYTSSRGSWSTPMRLDPSSTALDFQPTVRFDRADAANIAWVRDADGDVTTPDRQLMFSTRPGTTWSTPAQIPGLPAGPWTPSLDFDQSNRAVVAFVAPMRHPQTNELLLGADGNQSQLYVARATAAGWQSQAIGSDVFAERPVVRVNEANEAVVMFRRFGPSQDVSETGDLASSVASLAATTPVWATDYLTRDGQVNWQVAFEIDRETRANFLIWQRRAVQQTSGPVAIRARQAMPDRPDFAFGTPPLSVSNVHPLEGDTVNITALIKNIGLRNYTTGTFTVKFYDGTPGATPFASRTLRGPFAFGEERLITVPFLIPSAGQRTIFAVIDEEDAVTESSESNNVARIAIGQLPRPSVLVAHAEPANSAIVLKWPAPATQGITSYSIYRSVENSGQLEFVGTTTANEWTDFLAQPGVKYEYQIIGEDVAGVRSGSVATIHAVSVTPEFPADFTAPRLTILPVGEAVVLNWIAQPGLVLQETSSLQGARWRTSSITPIQSGKIVQASTARTGSARFFRLATQ